MNATTDNNHNLNIFIFMGLLFIAMALFTGGTSIKESRSQTEAKIANIEDARKEANKGIAQPALEQFPAFYQWDNKWGGKGYAYGSIANSGCGPTCLSMVYVYFSGDMKKTPDWMASYSSQHGHIMGGKTAWTLMSDGAKDLGLHVKQIPVSKKKMKEELKKRRVMICSMRPGDFTRSGHFIVITGMKEDGTFMVQDPNSKVNSKKTWKYSRIKGQIKNIWSYWN